MKAISGDSTVVGALKILIHAVSAKSGGAVTHIENLARALAKIERPHRYIFYVPPAQARMLAAQGNHDVVATDVGAKPSWQRLWWDQRVLRRIAKREGVDVIFSFSDFGMLFPPCRQILMIQNSLHFSQLYHEEILPRKSRRFRLELSLRRWLIRLSAQSSDLVMTASRSMLSDVRRFIPIPDDKLAVNHFGVPLEKFCDRNRNGNDGGQVADEVGGPGEEPLRLLYVSEYGEYKNFTTLLKALLLMKQQGTHDFHLTTTAHPDQFPNSEIVGRQLDKDLVSHPLIAPHLTLTGYVPYGEIDQLYRQADLFIFPSLAESFGHPLVEAMAAGLPIVASDIPICREICGEGALYFDPLSPKDLSEKILALAGDPNLRHRLGKTGRTRAETYFDWERHAQRLIELLEAVAL